MGDVVPVRFYIPRVPRDEDTERQINGDLFLLEDAAAKLVTLRAQIIREAKPLTPMLRRMVIAAGDSLDV